MNKEIRIKFVKKASQWSLTYFTVDSKGKESQKQEWFSLEEEAIKRKKEL